MDIDRRSLLQLAASSLVAGSLTAPAGDVLLAAQAPVPPGKPGEFDFLTGQWAIAHRRLKTPGTTDWDEFAGGATCWSILGGVASIEELRIPARKFSGMGLRLLDVERKVWSDFWVNAASGVLTTPGTTGGFVDGVGVFEAADTDAGAPIVVRGVWDRITPRSCRWYQTVSRDAGKTWQPNWFMDWTRV